MSVSLMAKALSIKTESALLKLVFINLCDGANDEGLCIPDFISISKQSGASLEECLKQIEILKGLGYLDVKAEAKKDGFDIYKININGFGEIANKAEISPTIIDKAKEKTHKISFVDEHTENEYYKSSEDFHPNLFPLQEADSKVYTFDQFWCDYTKKGNKKTSERKFSKLNNSSKEK